MRFPRLPPQPKLGLIDLLRRRRMTLQDFFKENVVNTYDELLAWCQLVGVAPPAKDEWEEMKLPSVSSEKPVKPSPRQRREHDARNASGPSSSQAVPDPNASFTKKTQTLVT